MGTIHTLVGAAVEAANEEARRLSLKHGHTVAIVTTDKSGMFLAWATVPQDLAPNEMLAGRWRDGERVSV
ncbi:hypothetical protein M0Q28_05580 [Patescibacteria group bacterium]|jgi:hypothetical protein|nr:hypothetical protein [Patescibacteria group bacterium]